MPPGKTPTSSLSEIELLFKQVLYRTLARIRRIGSGGVSPKISTTHCSPAARLPLDVVEMIIDYLRYDICSLRACTQTCYSWYIAAVPHLHHTLTVRLGWCNESKFRWPNPIRYRHMLGLLPLVKEFRVHAGYLGFSPKFFKYCTLRQFSALSNVQKLEIERLDIPSFIPRVQRYFGHFLPTVRSLVLREPSGTHRQIIYFIGLFQNLQDLGILYGPDHFVEESDPTLIPAFIPPLRGWLKLVCLDSAGFLKNIITLFGGIRFRYMDLYEVNGMGPLLDACATTLECVVLDPTDCLAESSLRDFDLSRIKSLRTLQVPWFSIDLASSDGSPKASRFLKYVLSTITSSAFSMVVVLYGDRNFCGVESEKAEEVSRHRRIFEVFREAHEVRGFQLKLCASAWGSAGEESARILEEAIAEERAENGFDDFLCDPFVGYNPRRSRFSRNAYVRGLSDFYSWVL